MLIRRVILLLFFLTDLQIFASPIITRHDKKDMDYIRFAESIDAISAIVRYSKMDLAGTLIRKDWILSAAHIARKMKPGAVLFWKLERRLVEKIYIHPKSRVASHDIALIKLKSPFEQADPVEIYRWNDEKGKMVILAGNGDHGTGITRANSNDGEMRAATNIVDMVSDTMIKWNFDDPRKHPKHVTEFEGVAGPGDSGGPAFIQRNGRYFLAGICSGQHGSIGRYGVQEQFTRVSVFVDWTESIISKAKID